MWLGTQYGLCRYDGNNIRTYFHRRNDPASLGGNFIWSTYSAKDGVIWVSNDGFLSKYQYPTDDFKNYPVPFNAAIDKIEEDESGTLWLTSTSGLMSFNQQSEEFIHFHNHSDTTIKKACTDRLHDFYLDKSEGLIYLAGSSGLKIYDYRNKKIVPLPHFLLQSKPVNEFISAITKDKSGKIWLGCGFVHTIIACWNPESNSIKYYDDLTDQRRGWSENRTLSMFTDRDGHVWIGGFTSSLSMYLPAKDAFHHYQNDPLLKSSIAGTSIISLYQDRSGLIWAGSEGYGVDRFQPGKNIFTTFQPESAIQPSLLHDWSRAAMEDSHGQLWFGTSKGISVLDTSTLTYTNYFNDKNNPTLISFNTIRSFAEDHLGHIWIGTGNGLNQFDPLTNEFTKYNSLDSLKSGFIWTLLVDYAGQLYVGGPGGLQLYQPQTGLFKDVNESFITRPLLRQNVRNLFEDSKQGIWIGFYDGGLLYYHPQQKISKRYLHDEKNQNSLCNNFVTSVIEDSKGIIWISTRDGLNSLDTKTDSFRLYTTDDGLPSNKTSALRIDHADRLWIATGKGLSVLDANRQFFRNFDLSDGLPTIEFNDQVAATTRDGKLIYPTYRGFILFNPDEVQQKQLPVPPIYISGIKVFNKHFPLSTNPEEIQVVNFRPNENFFNIELTGLNFDNPDKLMYAYKLEPFNSEWVYSKDRNVTYTNLSGGDYTFHYKATTDPSNWDVPQKKIRIHVGTLYYKTAWFAILIILLMAAIIYGAYSYRLRQTRNVHRLHLQATRLEKDKTEIQYQNLINQFNPHFLFNSLTSLNSLIYANKELASDFLEQLSAVYRYLLTNKETQLVTLRSEIDFVNHYISLLKTRFESRLQVNIQIPDHLLEKKIVPVTFQILIENAQKHNIIDESNPLVITITADDQYLHVSNNLQRKTYVETSNRKGLESLQSLYKYLSGLPFIVEETEGEFIIRVPLI